MIISQPYLSVGNRVAISPSTDLWMRGERYGEVVKIGRKFIHVKGDRTQRVYRFKIEDCLLERIYSFETDKRLHSGFNSTIIIE